MYAFQKINERFLVLSQSEAVKAVVCSAVQFLNIKEGKFT
jgi:hypothetical protein